MTTFLLVIVFNLTGGQRGVTIEKFDSHAQCFAAMQVVAREIPNVTASCNELQRGE
jgi:hypothetical protein